jgi:DNA replication protein DnaC
MTIKKNGINTMQKTQPNSDRPASPVDRRKKLMCNQTPRIRWRPEIHRDMRLVAESLRETFRQLIGGVEPWPLLLIGPAGWGKSCAALSLVDYVPSAWYGTPADLVEIETRPDRDRRLMSIMSRSLVVVDELGCSNRPDKEFDALKRLADEIDYRRVPAIIISNLDRDGLARAYDERIVDRLSAGTVAEMPGQSRRGADHD